MAYSTLNAFACHLVEKFSVNLEDFNSFNNNVIAVIGSLRNGYWDCSSHIFEDYYKFYMDGTFSVDISKAKESIEYISESISELANAKKEFSILLDTPMSIIHEDNRINNLENPTSYKIIRNYVNSPYKSNGIDITLGDFIDKIVLDKEQHKKTLLYYVNKSKEELIEELCYSVDDVNRLVELFYNKGDLKGIDALYRESSNTSTFKNGIVYLVRNVYYSLQGFNEEEFDEVMPKVIKTVLDGMCSTL